MKLRTLALTVALTATATAGLSFGVTEASASGTNVTYYACLNKGKLIHVGTTAPTCPSTATQISWNSQGPQGPPGANGVSHGYGANQGALGSFSFSDLLSPHNVGTVDVPAGDYLVTAHLSFSNYGPAANEYSCGLVDGAAGHIDSGRQDVAAASGPRTPAYGSMTLTGIATESSATTFDVMCEAVTVAQVQTVVEQSFSVVAVDALN